MTTVKWYLYHIYIAMIVKEKVSFIFKIRTYPMYLISFINPFIRYHLVYLLIA